MLIYHTIGGASRRVLKIPRFLLLEKRPTKFTARRNSVAEPSSRDDKRPLALLPGRGWPRHHSLMIAFGPRREGTPPAQWRIRLLIAPEVYNKLALRVWQDAWRNATERGVFNASTSREIIKLRPLTEAERAAPKRPTRSRTDPARQAARCAAKISPAILLSFLLGNYHKSYKIRRVWRKIHAGR